MRYVALIITLTACTPEGTFNPTYATYPPNEHRECPRLREKMLAWELQGDGWGRQGKCTTLSYREHSRPRSGGPTYVSLQPTDIQVCEGGRPSPALDDSVYMARLRCRP